jgi:diadenosine tetraphosphate (Ap4A) HIT family hydrolase
MSEHVELGNAREAKQREKMIRHKEKGICHFCPEGLVEHQSPVIYQGINWFITANDYPYAGAVHHYLIVSKRHIVTVTDLHPAEFSELMLLIIPWIQEHLNVAGYSLVVRNGKMTLTGATLDHLHVHFVVGVEKDGSDHEMILARIGYQKK